MYFSKASLRTDTPFVSVAPLLLTNEHNLVWTLFADHTNRTRDFLFRTMKPNEFYLYSERPPEDQHDLFVLDTKPMPSNFPVGHQLRFDIRVHATIDRIGKKRKWLVKDVIDELKTKPLGYNHEDEKAAVEKAMFAWWSRQGTKEGGMFTVSPKDFSVRRARVKTSKDNFGVTDLSGVLRIDDPVAFYKTLGSGFGRRKEEGCGLLLLKTL